MFSMQESKATEIGTTTLNTENNESDQRNSLNRQLEGINSIADDNTLHEYNGDISPKNTITVKKSSLITKHHRIETYPMESKDTRGVFFMVNIVDFPMNSEVKQRQGADEDAHSLLHLFKELGFKLFYYKNITLDNFWEILKKLLKSEYTKHTECFVMSLMTHGDLGDGVQYIEFGDGSVVDVKSIEAEFDHHVCPNLLYKPKVFLYPFCRGDKSENGIESKNNQTDGIGVLPSDTISKLSKNNQTDSFGVLPSNTISKLSDVIICYATLEGHKAHRDPDNGSWYIQYFVENMAKLAHDTAFEDILKKIQADTLKLRTEGQNLQTANYVNRSFNKVLYFNPGIYRESGMSQSQNRI